MNAKRVCEALRLHPDYLADVFKREVAHQHRVLAEQAEGEGGPELGGFGLQHISHLLHLIAELETEWERQHPAGEEGGDGAKEATFAAATASSESSRRGERDAL